MSSKPQWWSDDEVGTGGTWRRKSIRSLSWRQLTGKADLTGIWIWLYTTSLDFGTVLLWVWVEVSSTKTIQHQTWVEDEKQAHLICIYFVCIHFQKLAWPVAAHLGCTLALCSDISEFVFSFLKFLLLLLLDTRHKSLWICLADFWWVSSAANVTSCKFWWILIGCQPIWQACWWWCLILLFPQLWCRMPFNQNWANILSNSCTFRTQTPLKVLFFYE